MEQRILDFIHSVYQAIGWPGVVLLMTVESALIPIPSEVIMPLAGWMLISDKGLGWEWIILAGIFGAVGNVLGSAIAYWIGAWGGRPFLHRYGKYVLITDHDIESADRWFARYGNSAAFFSRLLPGVRSFISLPAGIARAPQLRFYFYTFLGSFLWCTGLAWGGYALGANWDNIRNAMRPFDIPIVAAVLLLIAYFIWRRLKTIRAQNRSK